MDSEFTENTQVVGDGCVLHEFTSDEKQNKMNNFFFLKSAYVILPDSFFVFLFLWSGL